MKSTIFVVMCCILLLTCATSAETIVDTGWSGLSVGGMGIYCNSDVEGQTCAVGFILDQDTWITGCDKFLWREK